MVGGAVVYHAEDLKYFIDHVHGTNNDLLKAVSLDLKEDMYLAGAKALGLLSKLVTAPLWRLMESPGHIADMNEHLFCLKVFFDKASNDSEQTKDFILGKSTPFDSHIEEADNILHSLIQENTAVDQILVPLLQNIFLAMSNLLTRMVPEHLPGGQFWSPTDEFLQQTSSAKKHNKMPEFVFGQLDHLVTFRPNASILTNEAVSTRLQSG